MRAIVLSGTGRYADPWHDFRRTSQRLSEVVARAGLDVSVGEDADEVLADLDGVDLLVVNAGDPTEPGPDGAPAPPADAPAISRAEASLAAALDRGLRVLAVHAAAASLRELAAYRAALGGEWVRGRSWHPPQGTAVVRVVPGHPVTRLLEDFTVLDERYTDLAIRRDVEPLADHGEGAARHVLAWAREVGPSRVVYDALGHDERSYDSAGHRALLASALAWLVEPDFG